MKRTLKTIIVSILLTILVSFNVLARPYNPNDYTSVNEFSNLLPKGVKQAKATESTMTRGDFFARADLIVQNNGNGNVGALAVAYTRYPVDEAYITIYLDRWDEVNERWRQVDFYEAEFYAKDYPDGLKTPTVDISFVNQEKGCYYRLRGAFSVMYNGEFEGFTPVTDGILLD